MGLGGQDIESMVAEPSAKATNSKLGLDAGSLSPCDEMSLSLTGWTMALTMPLGDGIESDTVGFR